MGSDGTSPGPRASFAANLGFPLLGSLLVLGLLACALRIPAARAQEELGEEQTVKHVEIHGNQQYDDGKLKKLLRTRGSGGFPFYRKRPLRSDYIRFDRLTLQDYYRRHGFLYARVDSVTTPFDKSGNRADVNFYLSEGPRAKVESVRFEGTGPIGEERLRRVLELKAGEPLDIPKQDLSRQAIENEYAERGYVAAQVRDSLEVDQTHVQIVYRIDPGPQAVLGKVIVEGTGVTKPEFVSREVTIEAGETLQRSKLLRSQQRIYDSGFYSDVQFDRGPIDSVNHATDLLVNVRERKMGWVDVGLGYGTVDQVRLSSQIGQRNLWRAGVRLVGTGRLGLRIEDEPARLRLGNRRLDVTLTRPWNFGVRVATTVGGYAEKLPQIDPATDPPTYSAFGGSVGLGYDLSLHSRSRLSYENRRVLSDSSTSVTPLGAPRASYTTNRIVTSLERDTRENIFDPRRGSSLIGTGEFAGGVLKGSARFLKFTGTASAYVPVDGSTTAAFRIRAGVINPQVGEEGGAVVEINPIELIPREERFFAGGATSVRGYEESALGTRTTFVPDTTTGGLTPVLDRLGGRILLLVNVELRRRLFGPIGGVIFFDGGNVWARRTDMKFRNIASFAHGAGYNDMRYGAGVGIRLGTPIGPVRLDYGWKIRIARSDQPDPTPGRGEFHFSVGQAF